MPLAAFDAKPTRVTRGRDFSGAPVPCQGRLMTHDGPDPTPRSGPTRRLFWWDLSVLRGPFVRVVSGAPSLPS